MRSAAGLPRHHEFFDALGRKGIVLAALAGALLIGAFIVAVVTVLALGRSKPLESVTSELAALLSDTGGSGLALLSVVGTIDGPRRMDEVRDRWQVAARRIARFCDGSAYTDGVERAFLCNRLLAARGQIEADLLRADTLSAEELHRLTSNLTGLVHFLRAYGQAYREQSSEAYAQVGEQRSLLLSLIVGTGGAMAASFVLIYVVAGAAADNRRRRLAAERSAVEAHEARQQLVEAIEAIPVGFGLYDRDGRMLMFNKRLADLNPEAYTPDIIGTHYEQILERLMARRPDGDRQTVHARLLARFRGPTPGNVQPMPDGRYFDSYEIHTPSGYIASCRVDVTPLKQRELQLEASEARYRHVVDSMLDAVFTTDRKGVTYVSPACWRVLGRTPEEIIGVSPTLLFHPDDVPKMLAALRAAHRAPDTIQSVRLRAGGLLYTGHWLDLRFKTTGAPDADGHYSMIGVVRDIEAQVQLEQAQRRDMLKMRSIVESSGALIALVDEAQRIVLANRSFLDAAGRQLDQVIGRRYAEIVDCGDAAPTLAAWLAGEHSESFAFDQVLGEGGLRRIVRVTASHVRDEAGRVNYSLLLGVDETVRRQAETRAIDAARLATLGEMATGMAHEINQPLTVIQFAVDAIEADLDENRHLDDPESYVAEARRHIVRVRSQAQRAAGIVRRLQGFARRGDEAAQPFDVAEAIQVGADLVGEQMRLARISVDLDLPRDLPRVHGYATRLQQVVINLMINARDAITDARTDAEGPVRQDRIDIRASHDVSAGQLVIEIGDSGRGIPEQALPRLFESFFTTKPKGKGTGLGLSISADIVAEMKGTISAHNRPQGGAVFRMSFPAVATDLPEAA